MRMRLDPARAIEIARVAAAGDPWAEELSLAVVETRVGVAIWIVSTPGVGRSLIVEVDDATEQVLSVGRVGSR